jgi:hypothetical protein
VYFILVVSEVIVQQEHLGMADMKEEHAKDISGKDNSEALNSLMSMLKGQFTDLIKYAECTVRKFF